jgi:hypothetical protein
VIKLWKENVSLLHKEALICNLFFNLTEKKHPYIVKREIIKRIELILGNKKMSHLENYVLIWRKIQYFEM